MKVLQSCLSMSWGGMEMYTLLTSQILKKAGCEVAILCFKDSRIHFESVRSDIPVYVIEKNPVSIVSSIFKFRKLFRNFDIIHSQASKDLWLLVPALSFSNVRTPLVFTKHIGSNIVKKDLFHRVLYKRVNLAIAISKVIQKNLVETTPLTPDKIVLLYDSIDTEKFDPIKYNKLQIRKEFGISPDELIVGMTGRISPGKGHEEFLYSAKDLVKKHKNLKFMIVGGSSPDEINYENKIKSLVKKFGLKDNVIFTGFRSDVPKLLACFDIFVFPSHAEAFGLALVEAMSMGLPSVCTSSDGVLDIALDHYTSYLFGRENYFTLKEKVEELIEHPSLRRQFGQNARRHVVDNFSLSDFVNKLLLLYEAQLKESVKF